MDTKKSLKLFFFPSPSAFANEANREKGDSTHFYVEEARFESVNCPSSIHIKKS